MNPLEALSKPTSTDTLIRRHQEHMFSCLMQLHDDLVEVHGYPRYPHPHADRLELTPKPEFLYPLDLEKLLGEYEVMMELEAELHCMVSVCVRMHVREGVSRPKKQYQVKS